MGQSGVMNLGAFMDRLGGRMDDGRVALVDEAFDRLDTSGRGHLPLNQVARERRVSRCSCFAGQTQFFFRSAVSRSSTSLMGLAAVCLNLSHPLL